MQSEFIYSTTFRLRRGVEEDEKIKRILDHYDKDKYRSVNNLMKKALLEFYAIEKQAASISKEDIADIIKEAVSDALSAVKAEPAGTEIAGEVYPEGEEERLVQEQNKAAQEQAVEKEQVGDEVLSFLNSFDDLYDD